jgi:hypothetical protein
MQSTGRSSSPLQPIVSTRPADMTFEDGKAPDTDQIISKNVNSELSATDEEKLNTITDTNISESKLDFFLFMIFSEFKLFVKMKNLIVKLHHLKLHQ